MFHRGLAYSLFCVILNRFIRNRNDHQATPQREKSFGLMKLFFILLRQLRRERHKIFLSQPHHQKGSGNDIVHQPVLVPQGTIQG